MIALLLKRYWLEALVGVAVLATGWYVYGEIKDWQAFTKKAGEDAARVVELEGKLAESVARNATLAGEVAKLEKKAKDDLELIAKRDAELAAIRAALNTEKRKYHDALAQLEGADRDCALRPVPSAADRLLSPWAGEAGPAGGSAGGARDAAGGAAGEARTPGLPAGSPVGRTTPARR